MQTVQQFVAACESKSNNEIYEMFDNASESLRNALYEEARTFGVELENESEPVRAIMYALGVQYNIQELRNY